MNRQWTKRGTVTEEDKILIAAIVKENPVASRIFLTGEVHEAYIGDIATGILYAANDTVKEPLFVQTKDSTVQMARFDPEAVWKCFDPKLLDTFLDAEEERLGLPKVGLDEWDFYASMVASLQMQHGNVSVPFTKKRDLGSFYQVIYLGCLWLYGKGGYMAVPVSHHFALPETAEYMRNDFTIRPLSVAEMNKLENLREQYKNVSGLTNTELNFLLALYEA